MQAIILATDENPRLPPLTDSMPGPLLPIVNRPVMATTLEILARAGCKHLLVSVCKRSAPIVSYFGDGKRWGVHIAYVTQREGWGSAGALKWAASLLNETFLVFPGDALIDLDIESAIAYHRSHGGVATIVVQQQPEGSYISNEKIADDLEVMPIGAFIFEPSVLRHIPLYHQFDTINDLIPALLAANELVFRYEMKGYCNALDTLHRFQEAQEICLYSAYQQHAPEAANIASKAVIRFPSITGRQIAPGIWVGLNDSIHPSVKIAPPVYIGTNSWIGRDVELRGGTVIGSNVVIDEEATLSNSTVLSDTYIGRLLKIHDRIISATTIMDPATGDCMSVTDPFLLSKIAPSNRLSRRLGRAFNTMIAALLLICLSPLFLVVWLLATIGSLGRPFIRRRCVSKRLETLDGSRQFSMFDQLRFRTRKENGTFIPFGRLIERWEWHRLPELINVLRGDMALVGVKALTEEQTALLTEEWHDRRYTVAAGFTGLWYLQSQNGNDFDTVVADVYYATMRNWRSDLDIVRQTPGRWFRQRYDKESKAQIKGDTMGTISHSETI